MFTKILIANRGEIACRVMKSARLMGIKTVAVYSDADKDALHVRLADEAFPLGGMTAAESYLQDGRILDAMKKSGAEAVHPGYGFLSENASFAEQVRKSGSVFIGPPASVIASMGDKIKSKLLAQKAGVSIIEGSDGAVRDISEARHFADKIGYPVMVKASAGGGGKGMRVVQKEEQLQDALRLAMSEAKASFGDERVFIEKFITSPRHIEIQILADGHGHTIHLGERDCSLQRRHQKVIEEAPSPFVSEDMRTQMGDQAVALAKAVGYVSAGTVEFVVGRDGNFYFLEMNTRLQVEHPVTELITGCDLVEWMIKIAAGEKLTLKQSDIKRQGWAMEARIYAEDPERGFLPSTGRLVKHRPPETVEESDRIIRLDTGVEEGSTITMFYDPMIAKLCVWAKNRDNAIATLREALDQYHIRGVAHNVNFLNAVLATEEFCKTGVTTNFIQENYPDGYKGSLHKSLQETIFPVVAAYLQQMVSQMEKTIEDQMEKILHAQKTFAKKQWMVVTTTESVLVSMFFDEHLVSDCVMEVAGQKHEFHGSWHPYEPLLSCRLDGTWHHLQIDRTDCGYRLTNGGQSVELLVLEPRVNEYHRLMPEKKTIDLSQFLLSPMPGLLVSLGVEEGQTVREGQELVVIEAMKMENILRAEKDAIVESIKVKQGDSLTLDQVILTFADK